MMLQQALLKGLLIVLAFFAVWFGGFWAVQQFGRAEVQEARASQAEAVVQAVQERGRANTISDAAQTQGRAVLVAPVRASVAKLRKETHEATPDVRDAGAGGDEWLRLFNDAVSTSNRAVRSAQGLP